MAETATLTQDECAKVLVGLQGGVVRRLRRAVWVHHGQVIGDTGGLEVATDAQTVWLKSGPDGTRLGLVAGEWQDPYAPPYDDEVAKFITENGRLVALDVSGEDPYSSLINEKILAAVPLLDSSGSLVAVEFAFPTGLLVALVEWDELYVWVHRSVGS